MGKDDSVVILGSGTSFTRWESNVQAALVKKKCLGHVFHDIEGIRPVTRPIAPIRDLKESEGAYLESLTKYEKDLTEWIEGEMTAKDVLITRMSKSVLPQSIKNMTAKQLFDHVSKSREEGATVPYQTAMRNLLNTKFTTTAEDYCDNFMRNYLGVNSAAESMIPQPSNSDTVNPFVIPHGVASHLFIIGTEAVEWLSTWRQTKVFDNSNRYVSLETMMSTLRQTGAGQIETMGRAMKMNGPGGSASEKPRGLDPNSRCEL
ncbi:hypothetical protein K3495_g16180, partial [Podosphaera aphanis]